MKTNEYGSIYLQLLTPEITSLLFQIHEYKGLFSARVRENEKAFDPLQEYAMIESIEGFCKLERITTSVERRRALAKNKTTARGRNEFAIAGYRENLNRIHESHGYIRFTVAEVVEWHKKMGGQPIADIEKLSEIIKKFHEFEECCFDSQFDPLILIPVFLIDFYSCQPLQLGNERLLRLINILLLYNYADIDLAKYVSLDFLFSKSELEYTNSCRLGIKDHQVFVKYYLQILMTAFQIFTDQADKLTSPYGRKADIVRRIIQERNSNVTKSEICDLCMKQISQTTVQRALNDLVKSGEIIKIGGGRYTSYIWNRGDN